MGAAAVGFGVDATLWRRAAIALSSVTFRVEFVAAVFALLLSVTVRQWAYASCFAALVLSLFNAARTEWLATQVLGKSKRTHRHLTEEVGLSLGGEASEENG